MLANSFGQKNYVEKMINVEMNLNHARSLWGFIKICLEQQEESGRFVMSQESAIKVINAWESLAKAIDGADKVPSKDAYGTVTIDAEVVE